MPTNIPQLQSQGTSSRLSASSSDEEEDFLSKDVVKLLLEKGLSNDVDAYLREVNSLSNVMALDPRQANQMMLNQYSQVNKIILNKANLEESIKRADSNSGLNEIAITTTGQVLVENIETGLIDLVSANELKDNIDIFRPLTNSELVLRRQTDPSLAFNTSIASVIGNGVGADKITSYILDIATKVGQSKLTSEGYVNKKEQNIAEGISQLLDGGSDGVYKVTNTQSDSSREIAQALRYIYSVLPQNMRNYLRVTSAMQGMDPEVGAYSLIETLMSSTRNTGSSTNISFDAQQSKLLAGDGEGSGSGSKEGDNVDQSIMITSGKGDPRNYLINPGTGYTIDITGEFWQTPHDKANNRPINKSMTLRNLLTDTSIAGTVDPGSIYMGAQRITEDMMDNVVYNNSDGFMTTLLPYTRDSQGHKVPNFAALEELSKVKDEIKNKGQISDIEKRQIYAAHNIEDLYIVSEVDPSAINENVLAPFLIFSGITSSDNDYGIGGINTNDPYLSVNDPYYKGTYINIFESVINEPETKGGKPGDKKIHTWFERMGILADKIIAGTVYIPLSEDKFSTYSAGKLFKVPKKHGFADWLMTNEAKRKSRATLNPVQATALGN